MKIITITKGLVLGAVILLNQNLSAQINVVDTTSNEPTNSAANILSNNNQKKFTFGTYAQIDYNQKIGDTLRHNGKMDVHRLVLFMGYKFNERTSFLTEIEYEHVKEVYIEQAFVNHNFNDWLNFRAGLLLVPMGIINEYHEPTTFNGVERPNLDSKIAPTTWRELGAGFAGKFDNLSLKYQLYVVNGFTSYNGGGVLRGTDGFRKGRQKAAESMITSPNLAGKVDYYGITGLKLGLSGYYGKTQSSMYDKLDLNDANALAAADSSRIGIAMVGVDARYQNQGFTARGQFMYANIDNSKEYNAFTGKDLGSKMMGYYAEVGYDLLRFFQNTGDQRLDLFARYEIYNTHHKVADTEIANDAYNRTDITTGLSWHLTPGVVLKGDYQMFLNEDAATDAVKQVNFGVGIWF